MFELIGLAIGGFIGYLVADFLAVLDPLRETIRQAVATGREKVTQLVGTKSNNNPLIMIGVAVVAIVILWWLLGFSSALLLGLVLGVVYKEEIGKLPFVGGIAENIRSKISGPR